MYSYDYPTCTKEACQYNDTEYQKLLDLCASLASLTRAWQQTDDVPAGVENYDLYDAVDEISEYIRTHHPDWQG